MARPKLQILVAALLVALCSTALSAAPLSDAEIAAMVAAHNAVRQRVAQAESLRLGGTVRIPDLTWDPALATLAQDWADQKTGANPPEHRPKDQRPDIGENIYLGYATEGAAVNQSPALAMQFWANEEQYYHWDTNTCDKDKECGHYTQVVWSTTTRVGCGRALWSAANRTNYVIWVCNYAPSGNITGQKPYAVAQTPRPGGQADTTRHFVEVHFTKIRVHNCNEGGICAWRLFCRLGNQPETLLLDNVEADDRDEPPINRPLTQDGALPVTVTCKLEERDAPIYEHLGTRSITIQQAGENTIRIAHVDEDGDIDEGDVSIFMNVQNKVQQSAAGQPLVTAPTTQPSDMLFALLTAGIDSSVPEADLRQWLNNSEFTPYPALAAALLKLLEGKRLRHPVYLDVIAWNYEHAPGASSPRSVADVDLALLRAAVLQGYNTRYGESGTDFQRLVDIFIIAALPAQRRPAP